MSAIADAYTEIHRRDQKLAPGSETPLLWPALLQLEKSTDLGNDLRRWLAAYDALEAHGPVQHYTEHQYLYDHDLAYLTGVVTFPAKVRDVFIEGQGLWSMRAAIIAAYRDGEKLDEVVLEGSPSETEVRESQARMELALLVALTESTPAEVQA